MSILLVGDTPALGTITLPRRGRWTATATLLDGGVYTKGDAVTLTLDGVTFTGTVASSSEGQGLTRVWVVGGAGRLQTVLEARLYQDATTDLVIRDALRDAGEIAGEIALAQPVARYVRPAEFCADILRQIIGSSPYAWRVRRDGVVVVEARDAQTDAGRTVFEIDDAPRARRLRVELAAGLDPLEVVLLAARDTSATLECVAHTVTASEVFTALTLQEDA